MEKFERQTFGVQSVTSQCLVDTVYRRVHSVYHTFIESVRKYRRSERFHESLARQRAALERNRKL